MLTPADSCLIGTKLLSADRDIGGAMVMKRKIFDIRAGLKPVKLWQTETLELPGLPVMPDTLLAIDLYRQEPVLELNAISEIVLRDCGATVQLFRAATKECRFVEAPPQRIEDCISGMGLDRCVELLSPQSLTREYEYAAVREVWEHSRIIALACRELVQSFSDGIRPGDAYLVGLLHQLAALPELLGWSLPVGSDGDSESLGLALAQSWLLPQCVIEYFEHRKLKRGDSLWVSLVRQAPTAKAESNAVSAAKSTSGSVHLFEMSVQPANL